MAKMNKVVVKPEAKAIAAVMPSKVEDEKKSSTTIDGLIAAWSKSYSDLKRDTAVLCAKIVVHALRHGDVTKADKMIAACGEKGKTFVRANVLRQWFETYGPFTWDTESKSFKKNKKKAEELAPRIEDDKSTAKFYGELVAEFKPWEEAKSEPEYKGYSIEKALEREIKRAENVKKEHGDDALTDLVGLDEVRNALAMIRARKAGVIGKAEAVAAAA